VVSVHSAGLSAKYPLPCHPICCQEQQQAVFATAPEDSQGYCGQNICHTNVSRQHLKLEGGITLFEIRVRSSQKVALLIDQFVLIEISFEINGLELFS